MARKNEHGLTDQQQLFCDLYLKYELNASKAYQEAYPKCKTDAAARASASKLLTNPNVSAYIAARIKPMSDELGLDAHWVLSRLMKVADRCMQAEPVMEFDPVEKAMVESGEYQFDSTGANKALELLGKYQKLFTDKKEVKHKGKVSYVQNLGGEG